MADAVSILPEELWKIILDYVKEDPNDLLSCYQTCSLFQSSLLESRTTWMFHLIYPFLHNQLKWNLKDVMSCRLVCRSWTKGVDTHMESHHFQPICAGNPRWLRTNSLWGIPPLLRSWSFHGVNFKVGHCEAFKADFKGSKRNPFVSRTLTLSHVNFSQALEFMKEFGCHLWALHLGVNTSRPEERITVTQVVKHLWDILKCVPSLKHLELGGLGSIQCYKQSDKDVQKCFETLKPLHLPHLVSLQFFCSSSEPPRKSYVQLRNILIRHFKSQKVTILYPFHRRQVRFPSLETRSSLKLGWNMTCLSFSWDTEAPELFLYSIALSHINCPLESLKVEMKSISGIDWLLDYILKFKDTLRLLTLTIENCNYENENTTWPSYFSSFISQLEKLERLEISFDNKTIILTEFDLRRIYSISNSGGEGGQIHSSVNLQVKKKQRVGRQIDPFGCYPLRPEDLSVYDICMQFLG